MLLIGISPSLTTRSTIYNDVSKLRLQPIFIFELQICVHTCLLGISHSGIIDTSSLIYEFKHLVIRPNCKSVLLVFPTSEHAISPFQWLPHHSTVKATIQHGAFKVSDRCQTLILHQPKWPLPHVPQGFVLAGSLSRLFCQLVSRQIDLIQLLAQVPYYPYSPLWSPVLNCTTTSIPPMLQFSLNLCHPIY